MTAFDTDILSDVFHDNRAVVARIATIPATDRFIPVVAVDEILRGRLAVIRQAEAGRGYTSLPHAYELFERILRFASGFRLLPYTSAADALFKQWRSAKIRVGTQDLRIAAIAVSHAATLVTRNARDYTLVPALSLDVWN